MKILTHLLGHFATTVGGFILLDGTRVMLKAHRSLESVEYKPARDISIDDP
jgi:hypothetical protein